MGKIVKYCAACEESFAEKFGFCPNCGQSMTAFEMNPVIAETKPSFSENNNAVAEKYADNQPSAPESFETVPKIEESPVGETVAFSANQTQTFSDEEKAGIYEEIMAEDEPVEEVFAPEEPVESKTFAAAAGAKGSENFYQTTNLNYQETPDAQTAQNDDGFHITIVEEKNVKQRNGLLLGTMTLMLVLVLGGTVYSLFSKELGIGAIEDGNLFAFVPIVEDVPMEIEEQKKPKDDKDGGGGGGGGKEEKEKASQGRLPTQTEKPLNPPSVNVPQLTNPTLRYDMSTQGNIKRPTTTERIGIPGSDNLNPSNGTGRGGGIGSGNGTGIGGGNGTGEGNGNGSGSGNGDGNGNGNGRGDGGGGTPPPPPKPKEVVTVPFRIISKPRATYTDAARQNQVTGVVRLRVTFSASGTIGSIAPVSGLPYGLTEQAISAARSIKFEPAKKNGVAQASTKIIEYSFTIY